MTHDSQAIEALVQRAVSFRAVFKKPIAGTVPHATVIATDPLHASGKCITVNWTTKRDVRFEDHSCVLRPGEHEWLVNPSYVYYTGARLVVVGNLKQELRTLGRRLHVSTQPLAEEPWKRLLAGFFNTGECPDEVHRFLLSLLQPRKS